MISFMSHRHDRIDRHQSASIPKLKNIYMVIDLKVKLKSSKKNSVFFFFFLIVGV